MTSRGHRFCGKKRVTSGGGGQILRQVPDGRLLFRKIFFITNNLARREKTFFFNLSFVRLTGYHCFLLLLSCLSLRSLRIQAHLVLEIFSEIRKPLDQGPRKVGHQHGRLVVANDPESVRVKKFGFSY